MRQEELKFLIDYLTARKSVSVTQSGLEYTFSVIESVNGFRFDLAKPDISFLQYWCNNSFNVEFTLLDSKLDIDLNRISTRIENLKQENKSKQDELAYIKDKLEYSLQSEVTEEDRDNLEKIIRSNENKISALENKYNQIEGKKSQAQGERNGPGIIIRDKGLEELLNNKLNIHLFKNDSEDYQLWVKFYSPILNLGLKRLRSSKQSAVLDVMSEIKKNPELQVWILNYLKTDFAAEAKLFSAGGLNQFIYFVETINTKLELSQSDKKIISEALIIAKTKYGTMNIQQDDDEKLKILSEQKSLAGSIDIMFEQHNISAEILEEFKRLLCQKEPMMPWQMGIIEPNPYIKEDGTYYHNKINSLYAELARHYPKLMEKARNNKQPCPDAAEIEEFEIKTLQRFLKIDPMFSSDLPDLTELLSWPISLPYSLDKENTSAPGYKKEFQNYSRCYYISNELMRKLTASKYSSLLKYAEKKHMQASEQKTETQKKKFFPGMS